MEMPHRSISTPVYRFGYQGQESDSEISGAESYLAFTYRVHDVRLGRFLSVDPLVKKYPFYSPYSFSGNRVIDAREIEGLEPETCADNWEQLAEQKYTYDNGITVYRVDGFWVYKKVWENSVLGYYYVNPDTKKWVEFDPYYEKPPPNPFSMSAEDWNLVGHGTLDMIGLVPVVGEWADGVNALWYLAEEDYANMALSGAAVVPVAGIAASISKYAVKMVDLGKGLKVGLYIAKTASGLWEYGSRSTLRRVLQTPLLHQAHHIIPWGLRNNPVVQLATDFGFHMNDIINGINLPFSKHLGWHPKYNAFIEGELNNFSTWLIDNGLTQSAENAHKFLSEVVIPKAKTYIDSVEKLK